MSLEQLHLRGEILIQAAASDAKRPSFRLVAYDGSQAMRVSDFGTVVVDLAGVDVAGVIPLLASHGEDLDSIVGEGRATIDGTQIIVAGALTDATPSGAKVLALARAGISLQASIGLAPEKREYVRSGDTVRVNKATFTAPSDGLIIVRAGRLREVSLVPVGANAGTTVSIAATAASNPKGTGKMDDEVVVNAQAAERLEANFRSAMPDPELEQRRLKLIDCWAPRMDASAPAELQTRAANLKAAAVAGDISLDQLRAGAVELIRAARPKAPAIHASGHDVAGLDAQNILAAACLAYLGQETLAEKAYGKAAMEHARGLGLKSIFDLSRFALHQKNADVPSGSERALKAAFSTTDLPTALADSAGKIALNSYAEQSATWKSWCDVVSVGDFKTKSLVRLGHTSGLDELPASGEIHHAALDETTASITAATFAKMIAIPRQLLINDDLGLIQRVAAEFGRLAMRKVSEPGVHRAVGQRRLVLR